jgi:hypothetical protein
MLRKLTVLFLFAAITAGAGAETADKAGAEKAKRKERLEKGEIVINILRHPKSGAYLPTGECLVEATVDEAWRVITDFDSFGKVLPNVVYYKPACWKGGKLLVDCRVKVALISMDYRLSYVIDEGGHTTYWSYVSGPIRDADGYWRVEPYDEGRILATYTTTVDAGRAVPAFVERALSKSTFPKVFTALRNRVKELRDAGITARPVITSGLCAEEK